MAKLDQYMQGRTEGMEERSEWRRIDEAKCVR